MDELLYQAVRDAGAHIGAVYLLADAGRVLLMDTAIGLPGQIAKPWARVRLKSPVPVAAAVRERRLVWVPDHEELARHFPGAALALPYHFAVAAAPIHTGTLDRGGLVLLWPEPHPPQLSSQELKAIDAARYQMGALMRRAAERGSPVQPGREPRILPPTRAQAAEPERAVAAMDCLNRLPEGFVALDLEGRITYVSPTTAELLGGSVDEVLGRVPWEVATWLEESVFEDCFRSAVLSQRVTACAAQCSGGRDLSMKLYPDPSGVTLRITPPPAPERQQPSDSSSSLGRPARAEAFYNLLHLMATLTRAVTMQDVIDLVADQVMPVCNVQAMAIVTTEGGRTRIVGSRGYGPQIIDRFDDLPVILPVPGERALLGGEPTFFATREELLRIQPDPAQDDGMSAWAFLPMIASGQLIGTCVLAYDHPHPFSADERATLTSLAGLVAQALDRAYVYDAKDRLAQSLQTGLLPHSLPRIPGLDVAARYLPATRGVGIGGDFYDLIRLDDTTAAAVIGDVQGHNMTAAALMGQVRTAVHAHAAAGASPGEVLSHTNRLLIDLDSDLFTSCLYIHIDLGQRALCAASAGHPPPLLRLPGTPTRVIDVPPGILLGIDPDATYPVVEYPLPEDTVLALYTDGLVETPGTDLYHSIANLATHLTRAPEQPLQDLADTLLNHAPHTMQRADDIALLLLRSQYEENSS
ncbi:SpoIIE family protein phosphatase [Nonomuraea sp. NPDC046570]|uniref:SpoIIE family protein phosphatase n=1 Tax=Nonomuraea sp. NPDC046570 TaxID=3155255 RepID=UPI0033EC6360